MSTSGSTIIATIKKGSYNIKGYSLYVDGAEKKGIGVSSNGVVSGYTLKGTEKSIKFEVSDEAGYVATSTLTLTPSKTETNSSSDKKD